MFFGETPHLLQYVMHTRYDVISAQHSMMLFLNVRGIFCLPKMLKAL
jgi:hypothetical protein